MWKAEDAARLKSLSLADVEEAICEKEPSHYVDHQDWARDCHSVSLNIVKSGLFEQARVARGSCRGVGGQHSWVVLGDDCYADKAPILDATLWSYDPTQPVLWKGTIKTGLHRPHGYGMLWDWGCPESGGGEEIELTPTQPLSAPAKKMLDMFRSTCGGPLDRRFWANLVNHAPVKGWPAAEIIAAMDDTDALRALVPIDILGMLTPRNPGGLYLPGDEKETADV